MYRGGRLLWGALSIILVAASAWAQTPTPTPVDSNIAVTQYAQSRGQDLQGNPCAARGATGCGGCYPDPLPPSDPIQAALAQLPKVNPEWQPIGGMIPPPTPGADTLSPPFTAPVLVTGTVGLSKSPGDDFPGSHLSADYNAEIIPDINSRLGTGNTNERVEFEWEGAKFPMFAWSGEGDRIIALGRWIFDCGHPDPGPDGKCSNDSSRVCVVDADCVSPGTCTAPPPNFGYQSEMHPPQAVAVMRNKSLPAKHAGRTAPAIPATRADVYISADGGGAGDRCVVTHLASDSDVLFSKACFVNHCSVTTLRSCRVDKDCPARETCITLDPTLRLADINAADFEFDMPLPPPPVGPATLQIKTKSYKPTGGYMPTPIFQPTIGPTPNLHVIVPMATPLRGGQIPNVFAESISAGWKEDTTSLTHVQVKLKSVTINNPLKDTTPALPHQCTNTNGMGLSGTPCTKDADCTAGTCANNGAKACHRDSNCAKTDICTSGSQCVGGIVPGWDLWGEVNGDWIQFKKLDTIGAVAPFAGPPYMQPTPTRPLKVAESFKFDEFVPPTGSIHLKVTGHSLNCLNTLYGTNLVDGLNEFGLTPGATCLAAGSHDPGAIDITYNGPNFGTASPGQATTFTMTSNGGEGGTCSMHTTQLCLSSADCPMGESCNGTGGAFTLEYSITVIP